jgi:hypothetical protein
MTRASCAFPDPLGRAMDRLPALLQEMMNRRLVFHSNQTSVITSKPAIHDHFKTGQRNYSGQQEFYRIFS